ncbi:MAG: hypothetical protein J3R72DRAFT_423858 [Linnemannia gamsii]|nr:MAG: hypothetical protein J3R72DRAFT_423858 [Linnemannia gamsii]
MCPPTMSNSWMKPCISSTHGCTVGDISSAFKTVEQVKTKFCTDSFIGAAIVQNTTSATIGPSEYASATPSVSAASTTTNLINPGTAVITPNPTGNNFGCLCASYFKAHASALAADTSLLFLNISSWI